VPFVFSHVDVCKCNNIENYAPTCNSVVHIIEKQMCAHPHVRLGHGSKDTADVHVVVNFPNNHKKILACSSMEYYNISKAFDS